MRFETRRSIALIISRYLIWQIGKPLIVILGTLIALFGGFSIADALTDAVNELVPVAMIAAMIALKLLISLDVLIPISLYLAVVMSFARLYGDQEFPAMFAMGVAPARVTGTVLALAGCLAVMVAGLSLMVRPWAYRETHALSRRAAMMLNVDAMQPGTFYVADHGRRVIFLAHRSGPAEARHVFVLIRHSDRLTVISARKADAGGSADVSLRHAHVYEIGRGALPDRILGAGTIRLDPNGAKTAPPFNSPVAASTARLVRSSRPADVAELQWRLSTGVSTLLLGMLGIPLSRAVPRQAGRRAAPGRGKYARFGTAILVYSVYYLLCSAARSLVQTGTMRAVPGLWWVPGLLALCLLAAMYGSTARLGFRRRLA